jgi:uncharacterized membrane protein YbhN (UPF0104 family)
MTAIRPRKRCPAPGGTARVVIVGVGASSFSPTPFGLGVVEAALIAALAAAGTNSPDAVRSRWNR